MAELFTPTAEQLIGVYARTETDRLGTTLVQREQEARRAIARIKARAWQEGRESLAQDLSNPLGGDGRRAVTPSPYEQDGDGQ